MQKNKKEDFPECYYVHKLLVYSEMHSGQGVIRGGEGTIRAHPLTNFEI